jgi:processive 1,2-diacylglycerol beta-glucosyltransferase
MAPTDPVRVLIFTAPVGDGHVAAARTLAADIHKRDPVACVTVFDALEAFNLPLRWLLRDAYRWQLARAPWLFGIVFAGLQRSRLLRWMSRALVSALGSGSIRRVVRKHEPDVIVSTFPATTSILGCLRLRGRVDVPVCATITDFAGVEMWADRGVDLHLVMHGSLVPSVERIAGPSSARVVAPLVGATFLAPQPAAAARRALGLPLDGRVVAVSGGGWGVGDFSGAVRAALELPDVTVICLAGRNEKTRAQCDRAFGVDPRVRVLGFTDQMSDILAAADVLVHSTGGVTCLEALARGCPIVAYGAPAGHAPTLARAMASLGLLVDARSRAELDAALLADHDGPGVSLVHEDAAADLVLALRPRVAPRVRARIARPLALATAGLLVMLGVLSSDLTYPLVAEAFVLRETTTIPAAGGGVPIIVSGDRATLLAFAPVAQRHHLHGSVLPRDRLSGGDVSKLRAAGLEPIPGITTGGVRSSLSVRGRLIEQVHTYQVGKRFYFIAPTDGFTIADYLVGRHLGGVALQSNARLGSLRGQTVAPGAVVTAELRPGRAAAQELVRSWSSLVSSVGIVTPVPSQPPAD